MRRKGLSSVSGRRGKHMKEMNVSETRGEIEGVLLIGNGKESTIVASQITKASIEEESSLRHLLLRI